MARKIRAKNTKPNSFLGTDSQSPTFGKTGGIPKSPLKDSNVEGNNVVRPSDYVGSSGILNYGEVAFGNKQTGHGSPLRTYPGFTTQIPFNSTINQTIIQNPSPIPVTTYYQIVCSVPIVYQSIMYIITTIISKISEYNSDDEKVTEFARLLIKRVNKEKLFRGLLTAIWSGFADIKIIWGKVTPSGKLKPFIDELGLPSVKSILVLPPESILLAVTPEGELDDNFGVMQYYYNTSSIINQNYKGFSLQGTSPLASYGSNITPERSVGFNPIFLSTIPKAHRIHYTFNPIGMAGNHYGESMIKPIFSNIMDLNNLDYKIQVAATYKASPLSIFETDSNTSVQLDPNDVSVVESLHENTKKTLKKASQTGYMVFDGLNSVKYGTIDNSANFDQFVTLRNSYIENIRAGLCTPNLTGNNSSYANSVTNNKNKDIILDNILKSVVSAVEEQLMHPAIRNAFGNDVDLGGFEILDTSLDDKAIWIKILESAKNSGLVDITNLDDLNKARSKIDFNELKEVPESSILNVYSEFNQGNGEQGSNERDSKKTDINKTKQDVKKPYANGLKEIGDDVYNK